MEWLVGLLGALGGGLAAAVPLYLKLRQVLAELKERGDAAAAKLRQDGADHDLKVERERGEEETRREGVTIQRLNETIELLRSDGREFRAEIHDLRDRLNEVGLKVAACEAERAWLQGWVEANRAAFERAGIEPPGDPGDPPPRTGKAKKTASPPSPGPEESAGE